VVSVLYLLAVVQLSLGKWRLGRVKAGACSRLLWSGAHLASTPSRVANGSSRVVEVAVCPESKPFLLSPGLDTPPQFQTTPSNVTAFQFITLPCSASGNPAPTITWYKDGAVLGADSRLSQAAAGGLMVTGLHMGNGQELEGTYQCQASNRAGAVRSLPATLTRTGECESRVN